MRKLLMSIFLGLLPLICFADQRFPSEQWQPHADPVASPDAYAGGEFSVYAGQYPKSLNYYLDTTVSSSRIFSALYETLLGQNGIDLKFEPNLASSWSLSDDKLTMTFHIDERARWSDGVPVTALDVAWTFATILDPKNLTGPNKIALERFNPPEIIDEHTIRFTAKEAHWQNLLALSSLEILPKHAFERKDFNKINFEFPVVSGPYRIKEIKEGRYVILERRDDWWQRSFPGARGVANFARIKHVFMGERENAFEAFKTGKIDYFPIYTANRWAVDAQGEAYDKNWIVKQKIYNHEPVGFQGFAMNLRRKIFSDKRVRLALAHLLDRKKMNSTLMHNAYFLHQCYFEGLYDDKHPCPGPRIDFDKDKARKLLAEAGWTVNKATGLLEKDGQQFVINFLTRDSSTDKFLVIYSEDLKDVGIQLSIIKKDWAAWIKDMDEYNFDMTWAAWGASLFNDPEPMWLSTEAGRPSGQNITGYRNKEVDKLIIAQRTEFDVQKRNDILRRIDAIITQDIPYILLWNINYVRLLYWNKFGMPPTVLGKYSDEAGAFSYWWFDEDQAADLDYAMKNGDAMPRKPAVVHFDQAFKP